MIPHEVGIKKFNDPLEEKRFIIESNLMRRQLTKFQRIEAALPLIEIERELAEKRKKLGNPYLKDPYTRNSRETTAN